LIGFIPIKEDVSKQLNKALSALEEANPELDGVLKHIDVLLRKMAKKRT
jgi:ABC-type transporter Mla subunit MlaD